jgi:hypothetical protein
LEEGAIDQIRDEPGKIHDGTKSKIHIDYSGCIDSMIAENRISKNMEEK